jgi:uncharacterized membrane protein
MSSPPPSSQPTDEPGHVLSLSLIAVLVFLLVVSLTRGGAQTAEGIVAMGLFVMAWGLMFLLAFFFSHKSAFLRGLIWFCEHFSYPGTRKMAFFYFAVCLVMGGASVLRGLGLV